MKSALVKLGSPVARLTGVGIVVERALAKLNIHTAQDLLLHYPRRWEDYSQIISIANLGPGLVTVAASVENIALKRLTGRRLTITEAILSDDTGTIKAVWFNQPYLLNTLKKGEKFYFAGEFAFKANSLALQNPTFSAELGAGRGGRIYPIYPETAGLSSKQIAKLIDQVLPLAKDLEQIVPTEFVDRYNLLTREAAIVALHRPSSANELARAKSSIGFEELFILLLTGLLIRAGIAKDAALPIEFDKAKVDDFLKLFEHKLTDAQKIAAWQILGDISKSSPMNRLLQGDVGSGKTVVAFLAAAQCANAGVQTAILVPTEILARQHYKSAQKLLEPLGIKTALLVAGVNRTEKAKIYTDIEAGEAQIIIGTHALLNEKLTFANLGFVVIDEQHRFGVTQRDTIKAKAKLMPHLLSMSATPIPRSLALIVYADLDISIIDKLPPGRIPINTKVYTDIQRANAYDKIDAQIGLGRQAYIVCPLIAESDISGKKSVEAELTKLQKTVFSHRKITALHGKMKQEEKNQIMNDFVAGKFDILIATTVVEVGLDVPNATVMLVEGADNFGLAALHQLRGRVGRGVDQSYCFLIVESGSSSARARLGALEHTTDGFRLAQIDLENRGAGEIYGTRQHGILDMRFADITDVKLVANAKTAAKTFMLSSDVLEYPAIATSVANLAKVTTLD